MVPASPRDGTPINAAIAGPIARVAFPTRAPAPAEPASPRDAALTTSRLANFSILACTGAGAQTVAVGFAIGGSGAKQVLLRGVGPTLAKLGVAHALAYPRLLLFNDRSLLLRQNDSWGGDVALQLAFNVAGAFPFPVGSQDAALIPVLAAGCYTAQVAGRPAFDGATPAGGETLIQVYDLDPAASPTRFVNFSARTRVGPGAHVLAMGFTVTGNAPKTLLVRGIGPALAQFGVSDVLADPQLTVFGMGAVIASNDGWSGTTALSRAFQQAGAFPLPAASNDAATVITVQPGTYIVQLSSVGETTGVALIELYELP